MVTSRSSSLFCCSLARVENTVGKPSSACFFHRAICVGCTSYSAAISFAVLCRLMASNATLVFSSALYRLRCLAIDFLLFVLLSIQLFYLIYLSRKLGPLYCKRVLKEDHLYSICDLPKVLAASDTIWVKRT